MTLETPNLDRDERRVTVCDKCETASCWDGIYMCADSYSAGTVDIPVYILIGKNREHRSYWDRQLNES